jgi:hypothetical protein
MEVEEEQLDPWTLFLNAMRTPMTRDRYQTRVAKFFNFSRIPGKTVEQKARNFTAKGKSDANWAFTSILRFVYFQRERVDRKEISGSTLRNYAKSIKLFCEMADISIPWKKITRGLPRGRKYADDRIPTLEELRKLVEYPDRRIKAIVFTMTSSGSRVGMWDYLRWCDLRPIEKNGEIIAAKMIVYAEGEIGREYLGHFQEINRDFPVIAVTSRLMSTGVDVPTCRVIAIDKTINSITDFKQIIGRGTRVFEPKDKMWFTIIDYRKATRLFKDEEWDGHAEINKTDLGNVQIPIPSIKIQKEIINKLDYILGQIEEKKKRYSDLYEKVNSELMVLPVKHKQFILKKIISTNHNNPTWKYQKLEEVCDKITDGTHKTPTYANDGVPFLRVKDIHNDHIDWDATKKIPIGESNIIKRKL